MPPLEMRTYSPRKTPEVPYDPYQHWRGILRLRLRLLTRSVAPASKVEEPERHPSNSQGDWPLLSPPVRVPVVSIVSREHLLPLEKIQEVLPSRRDEALFR